MPTTKTTPSSVARKWINNVRVDLNIGSPVSLRVDFSLGPYYEIGDPVRLIDLDPAQGHVVGCVTDLKKYGNGTFAYVEWKSSDLVRWDPQEF